MLTLKESVARVVDQGSSLAIVRSQEITKDFLDDLHSERMAKQNLRTADHERVATVPTMIVDLWLAQGVPFWDLTAREIVTRLDREGLSAFITTTKAV